LISVYKLTWSGAYKANEFWFVNSSVPIAAISTDVFISEELRKFQQIKSLCEQSLEIVSLPVYDLFAKVVQNISGILSLARKLQSTTMKDTHWSRMNRIVGGAFLHIWAIDSSATEGLDRMSTESDSMDIQRGIALSLSECVAWIHLLNGVAVALCPASAHQLLNGVAVAVAN
jgi:hypothetical protein